MYCYKCGCELNKTDHCPNCGADVRLYKKIIYTSNELYNDGLQKAQVRDLSGAILSLKNSLWYNKDNLDARNLLGLVYYEMGETVAALSEWVISKNINDERLHRKQNPGENYLAQVQASRQTMENLEASIERYNHALECCYTDNLDVAVIQLKKVLQMNPHYLRARQLLALLYIEGKQYKRALRELQRCERIDIGNTTTLRYLQEVENQLQPEGSNGGSGSRNGQHTVRTVHTAGTTGAGGAGSAGGSAGSGASGASRSRANAKRNGRKVRPKVGDIIRYTDENETIIQPVNSRNPGVDGFGIPSWIYGGVIGLLVGAALVAFIIMPARVQSIRSELQTQVREVSSASDSKDSQISDLQSQVDTLNAELSDLQTVDESTTDEDASAKNDSLMNAAAYYIEDSVNIDNACTALAEIDPATAADGMSDAFVKLYNDLYPLLRLQILQNYADSGMAAYEQDTPDYQTAADDLEKANEFEDSADYGQTYPQRQYYLADSYWHLYQAAADKSAAVDYITKARAVIAHEAESFPSSDWTARCNELLAQLPDVEPLTTSEDASGSGTAASSGTGESGTDSGSGTASSSGTASAAASDSGSGMGNAAAGT